MIDDKHEALAVAGVAAAIVPAPPNSHEEVRRLTFKMNPFASISTS